MKKVLMIGLDGATFTLLKPLMADGTMPFLKQLIARGVHGDLMSTQNPLTPPAWVSMVTGRSPNAHGIYDFLRPESSGEATLLRVNDSRDIKVETVWSMASRQGKKVTSFNFYGMSPPFPINGYLISGFIPWKYLRKATHPPAFFDKIKNKPGFDYKHLGMDISQEKKAITGLRESEYEAWLDMQSERDAAWTELLADTMAEDPCDLTAIVYDGTDKIQHLFWRYLDPALVEANPSAFDAKIREKCLSYYRQIDAAIERLVTLAGPETNVLLASDHGFGETTEFVYINEWLAEHGYLTWAKDSHLDESGALTADTIKEHTVMIDWENTVAYSLTPSSNGVFIKLDTGNGKGIKASDYPAFVAKLQEQLRSYRDPATGTAVFTHADLNAEKLHGTAEHLKYSPDITLKLRDGGFVSILRAGTVVRQRDKPDGTHRPNGIFIASGPDIKPIADKIDPLQIVDMTPIFLYLLGLPIATDLEGQVPQAIINPATLQANPVKIYGKTTLKQSGNTQEISDEEKNALMDQMKLLGYMD